ncbi:hypothetical protein ARAM_002150 [Aspergillus rambellii]|uniref:XPG-I domain-containing protein n=1 Tax=Aspergillus rambellii TaxID=308745 RepID=A0A0F8VJU7_9EURO|nr:hypothetical protein ARAM_002150 [Aspergillus rambellii]
MAVPALPIHPLFVYDGKDKPPFKRGKAVSGRSYGNAPIIQLSKVLIDLFKFPRHDAPGEAEAECARLQTAGVVDAVMSNDVDAIMFGSKFTVMNFSKESGSGSGAATHVTCYQMANGDMSKVKLDRSGMILFAMLSGGDYLPSGVPKCGSKLAAEIAKAGFGADLLEALDADCADLEARLDEWRDRLQYELEENESGYFQTKHKVVRIPETFPDRTILSWYAKPVVSPTEAIESLRHRLHTAWDQDIDALQLRKFAAEAFEWNYRSGARKMIRLLAEPLVSYKLRLGQHPLDPGIPRLSDNDTLVLQKVYKSRTSFSTDGLTELQLEIIPVDIVGLDLFAEEPNPPLPSQETTISGDEEEGGEGEEINAEITPASPVKKRVTKRYDPYSPEKVWIFETLALMGIPEVVESWKKEQSAKLSAPKKTTNRKSGPRKRKELDPGMKQGSILKYGTLRKRSDMTEYKSAQLFEAAISSTPPTKSPTGSYPGTSGYGLQTMGTPPNQQNRIDGFDYLVDRFSSCNLSPSPVKHRPAATRARIAGRRTAINSSGSEIEVVEITDGEDSPPPAFAGRIQMSYSNASYKELHCHRYFSQPSDCASPRGKPRQPRPVLEQQDSAEVTELEQAISSIKLSCETPKKKKLPKKDTSRKISAESELPTDNHGPAVLEEASKELPMLKRRVRGRTDKEANSDEKTAPGTKNETILEEQHRGQANSQNSPTHLESITVCGGYWTVDTATDTKPTKAEKAREKKKRIARVSILDLT